MTIDLPRCACGCGTVLVRAGRRGPAPQYAAATCRKRAERRRRQLAIIAEANGSPLPRVEVPVSPSSPVDDQVARALVDARGIAFALQRLGAQARPELAWRCTKLGDAIVASITDAFGKDIAR